MRELPQEMYMIQARVEAVPGDEKQLAPVRSCSCSDVTDNRIAE